MSRRTATAALATPYRRAHNCSCIQASRRTRAAQTQRACTFCRPVRWQEPERCTTCSEEPQRVTYTRRPLTKGGGRARLSRSCRGKNSLGFRPSKGGRFATAELTSFLAGPKTVYRCLFALPLVVPFRTIL